MQEATAVGEAQGPTPRAGLAMPEAGERLLKAFVTVPRIRYRAEVFAVVFGQCG